MSPRWIPVVLIVVAASAVVAIGSSGVELLRPPADLDDETRRLIRIAGACTAFAGLLALHFLRNRGGSQGAPGQDPAGAAMGTAAGIMTAVALMALLMPSAGPEGDPDPGATAGSATSSESALPPPGGAPPPESSGLVPPTTIEGEDDAEPPPPRRAARPAEDGSGLDWDLLRRMAGVLAGLLLLVVLVVGALAFMGRLGGRPAEEPSPDPSSSEGPDAGPQPWWDVDSGDPADPRGQIIRAYRRLLGALALVGAHREPYEAPFEHLGRAMGPLGVRSGPPLRLAELYVAAEFSERPITRGHQAQAAEALDASLADLRETGRWPEGDAFDPGSDGSRA